ncbi:Tyrosine kinase [Armadillidium vulgare iridescent virus]|uniref:Tyrosine kinase n=1 Tax=Armadillidium vulgare iridescent virus TaxID=72201 RepID=A0A068QKL3_9VIRU|nr:Tyrosine kinase [Armadillidium vulgare iridescent virus]CCV02511.1 Tyrosine kinase [Armadillidium vulgare iridescent virus]
MNDIIYIIDKIRNDNQVKYSCVEPFLPEIELSIKNGSLLEKLPKREEEEKLRLLSYLFYGCVSMTLNTSTIAPVKDKKVSSLKMGSWLKDIQLFGVESKQGNVYKGKFLNQPVVLKQPKKSFFLENTLKDYFNGIYCVNKLRIECPLFAYTYGLLTVTNKKATKGTMDDELWLVTEYINGKTLKAMLTEDLLSFKDFLDIFVQILIALEIGQEKYKFCHYDLHTDNIIIDKILGAPYRAHVFVYDIDVNSVYRPVLIDYGMSSISPEKNVSIGQHKIEKNGIFHYLFPGYDAYVFLLFCRDIANNTIQAGIDELFKFYGSIDHVNYVSTLKNNTGRQTPLLFLEYIRKTYPHISFKFSPRTAMNKSLLVKSPTVMLVDLLFEGTTDITFRKTVKQSLTTQKNITQGFIHFMIECIRNKKWFDEENKNFLPLSVYKKMISRDMDLFDSIESHVRTTDDLNQKMENSQYLVNILFLIRQLRLEDFKPYREWAFKFESSDLMKFYKSKKPHFDLTERLK